MSDYFGASLRSAGAPLPAMGPDMPSLGEVDLVERQIEVEALAAAPMAQPERGAPERIEPVPQVEVSIGTIHVTVDAPPAPRAAAQAPAPTNRTQLQRPAPRSGFSRARLPRL